MKITEILEQVKKNQVNKLFKTKQKLSKVESRTILGRASFEILVGVTNKIAPKKVISEETALEKIVKNTESLLRILNEALDKAYEIENNNNRSRANSTNSVNLLTEISENLQTQLDNKSESLKILEKNYSNLETLHMVSLDQINNYKKELNSSLIVFNEQKELINEKESQLAIKDDELKQLISEGKAKEEKIKELIEINHEIEEEKDQLITESEINIQEWEGAINELEEKQKKWLATDKVLKIELTELEKKNKELEFQLKTSQDNFENEEEKLLVELSKVKQDLVDEKDSYLSLERAFDTSERENESYLVLFRNFQQSIYQLNKEREELKKELKNEQAEVVLLEASNRKLTKQAERNKDKLDELNQKLFQANKEKKKRGKKIGGLITESRTIKNELLTTQAEVADLETLGNNLINAFYNKDQELITSQKQLRKANQQITNLTTERDTLLTKKNNHTCPVIDNQAIEREILKEIINQLNLTLSEEVSVKEVITELKALIDKKPLEVPVEVEKEKIVKVENTSLTNSLKQEISELEKELSLVKSKGDLLVPITCAITIPLLLIIMVLLKKRRLVNKKR